MLHLKDYEKRILHSKPAEKGSILEINKAETRKMIKQVSKAKKFGFFFIKIVLRRHHRVTF